jgi:hypothetical protein
MYPVASAMDDYGKYYDLIARRTDEPLPKNPTTEEEEFLVGFGDIMGIVNGYRDNPGVVIENQENMGSKSFSRP